MVDALNMCYTKAHVDTFVILSGDSDFSPLVSKLRENNKVVIGVGVKKSTSDLLTANCDDFLFYDDVVREQEQKKKRAAQHATGRTAGGALHKTSKHREPDKRQEALDIPRNPRSAERERGAEDKIWGSMVKQALKRRQPGFNESYYGFAPLASCWKRRKSASSWRWNMTRNRAAPSSACWRTRGRADAAARAERKRHTKVALHPCPEHVCVQDAREIWGVV